MRRSRALGLLATTTALVLWDGVGVSRPVPPFLVTSAAGGGDGSAEYDVVVIGATSAGVGAAIGAAREGARVLLTDPTDRVGGMLTNGVTTDMLRQDASSGLFDEHRRLVRASYRGHPDAALSDDGFNAAPDVALAAVRKLLDHPGIELRTGVRLEGATFEGRVVTGATLTDAGGTSTVLAPTFIDGTVTGDLLGAVGVEGRDWVVGREGGDQYGESLAPEEGDRLQQAYNYRLTVQVGGRTDFPVPATYAEDRARYASIDRTAPGEGACTFTQPDGASTRYTGMRIQRCLPDRKMDINVDLLGMNHGYPTADAGTRAAVESRLAGFTLGYLHWLRTEAGMPELGLPLDDYVDNDGFPSVLYVREGRRAKGRATFTQHDAAHSSTSPDAHPRSIAIGEYGLDSHCVGPPGGVSGGPACQGGFWHGARPYSVPYDIMVPLHFDNLLVPAALSASHVGYSTLRMEPVLMNIGYAAGIAAAIASRTGTHVANVEVPGLQRNLVQRDQAIVYLPGLPTSGPDFIASQLDAVRSPPSRHRLRHRDPRRPRQRGIHMGQAHGNKWNAHNLVLTALRRVEVGRKRRSLSVMEKLLGGRLRDVDPDHPQVVFPPGCCRWGCGGCRASFASPEVRSATNGWLPGSPSLMHSPSEKPISGLPRAGATSTTVSGTQRLAR